MVKNLDKVNALVKYFRYLIRSRHRKGHGIHSPAVYEFVSKVIFGKTSDEEISDILEIVQGLSHSKESVKFTEFGAGSVKMNADTRKISEIVRVAGISKKFGKLLYRLSQYYKPNTTIELGTSLGISTLYLAKALKGEGKLVSVEGNAELTLIAKERLAKLGAKNINLLTNTFEEVLPDLVSMIEQPALIFIDGNHEYDATLNYLKQFLPKIRKGMIIIGDIYWSIGMEMAWKQIQEMSTVTVDLYYMGIIIVDEMLTPGHYIVRY